MQFRQIIYIPSILWVSILSLLLQNCGGNEEAAKQKESAQPNLQATNMRDTKDFQPESLQIDSVAETSSLQPDKDVPNETFEGTRGIVEEKDTVGSPAFLQEVRAGQHETFDRVVFEFDKRIPGYHVEYIDSPVYACGSGNVVDLAGDGFLEMRFEMAKAHTTAGHSTVTNRERRLTLQIINEMKMTCDFEARVVWVLGLKSPNRFRVLELAEPPRIVVDIRH